MNRVCLPELLVAMVMWAVWTLEPPLSRGGGG